MKDLHARRRAERTHFKCGHAITPANTYTNPAGAATCRECKRASQRAAKDRAKAAGTYRDGKKPRALRTERVQPGYIEARTAPGLNGCLLWVGPIGKDGYGDAYMGGTHTTAHRAVWIEAYGPVPPGWTIDHLCRVRACVELSHLDAVPHALNVRRGIAARNGAVSLDTAKCPRGHEYDETNTYGYRICGQCRRAAKARFRERRKSGDSGDGFVHGTGDHLPAAPVGTGVAVERQ